MKPLRLLAAALLFATPALAAHSPPDPGAHIMKDYVLTMPKLKAYEAAYGALVIAAKSDPSLKADVDAASSENDPTIATTIAKMDHHPRVYAFFQKQGLSKPEAALIPLIVMDACSTDTTGVVVYVAAVTAALWAGWRTLTGSALPSKRTPALWTLGGTLALLLAAFLYIYPAANSATPRR